MTAHDNPLGLDGFEFVEFTGPDPDALAGLFTALGFTHMGNHKTKNVRHYAQGDINHSFNTTNTVNAFPERGGGKAKGYQFGAGYERKIMPMYARLGGPSFELWLIPEERHVGGFDLHREEYEEARRQYEKRTTRRSGNPRNRRRA